MPGRLTIIFFLGEDIYSIPAEAHTERIPACGARLVGYYV